MRPLLTIVIALFLGSNAFAVLEQVNFLYKVSLNRTIIEVAEQRGSAGGFNYNLFSTNPKIDSAKCENGNLSIRVSEIPEKTVRLYDEYDRSYRGAFTYNRELTVQQNSCEIPDIENEHQLYGRLVRPNGTIQEACFSLPRYRECRLSVEINDGSGLRYSFSTPIPYGGGEVYQNIIEIKDGNIVGSTTRFPPVSILNGTIELQKVN